MPITFQQPSPVSASTSIGAGRADVNTKEFSALAGLVESYGRLAAQAYGGRGGGGGYGGGGGGAVQVLPTSDYGGLAQVEGNANREQGANNLGTIEQQRNERLQYELAPENDPVARHITQQENFQTQRAQQIQAANDRNKQTAIQGLVGGNQGGQPQAPQQGPPPSWEVQDEQDLVKQKQILRGINDDINNGRLGDPDAIDIIKGNANDKYMALANRKQAATQYAQADQEQQQMRAQQIMIGQQDRLALESRAVFRQHGQDGIVDKFDPKTGEYMGSLQWNPKTQTMEAIKGLEPKGGKATAEKPEKEVPVSTLAREAEAEAKMSVKLTGDHTKDVPAIHDKATEIFNRKVNEQSQAREAKAQEKRMKEASPEVVKAFQAHVATIPQQDGQFDFNRASPQQLERLDMYYAHPKEVGIDPAKALRARAKLAQIIRDRNAPPPIVTPPPVSRSFNTPEMLNTDTGLGSRYR